MPGRGAQLPAELLGQPFQVAVGLGVGPVVVTGRFWPAVPAGPAGPLAPLLAAASVAVAAVPVAGLPMVGVLVTGVLVTGVLVTGVLAGLGVPPFVPVAPFVLGVAPGFRSRLLPAAPGLAPRDVLAPARNVFAVPRGVRAPARYVFAVPRDVLGPRALAGLRRALPGPRRFPSLGRFLRLRRALLGLGRFLPLRRALLGLRRALLGLGRFLGACRFPSSRRLGPGPRLVDPAVPHVPARVGTAGWLVCPLELARGPAKFLAQGAHGLPDVLGDLAGDVADRRGDLFLKLGEVVQARVQFFPALVGDAVHLPAVGFVVRDEALFLEPGQPRVDRPG